MRSLTIILLVVALLYTGCGGAATPPPDTSAVSEEVVTYLVELNNKAGGEITTEIVDLDKRIAKIEKKEGDLSTIRSEIDRVIASSEEWIAERKEQIGYYWKYSVPEENIKRFENESYQLVKFELVWTQEKAGWRHFDTISIKDRATGATGTPESFETDLQGTKSIYVNRKTAKLRAQEKANQILTDVLRSKEAWKINEMGNGIYSISGYGLGYTDQLSIGEWYYYENSKTVEPRSQASIELKNAITGK